MKLLSTLQNIDPSEAVKNISNAGLMGSLFIIALFFLVGIVVVLWRTTKTQIKDLTTRLDTSEKEADKSKTEFLEYIKEKNDQFVKIIEKDTESRNLQRLVFEKILNKI